MNGVSKDRSHKGDGYDCRKKTNPWQRKTGEGGEAAGSGGSGEGEGILAAWRGERTAEVFRGRWVKCYQEMCMRFIPGDSVAKTPHLQWMVIKLSPSSEN